MLRLTKAWECSRYAPAAVRTAWISGWPADQGSFSSPQVSGIRPDLFTAWPGLSFGSIMAEGKHAVFESAHSVKTPLGVDFGRIGAKRKFRAPDRRGIQRRSAGKRRDLQWAVRRRGRSSRDATRSGWISVFRFHYAGPYFAGRCGGWLLSVLRSGLTTWTACLLVGVEHGAWGGWRSGWGCC